jgi:hypothetical protein
LLHISDTEVRAQQGIPSFLLTRHLP